jgi:hypothetical protein
MVEVPGFEHEDPAQLLFRLGIRAIGDGHLAVLPSQGGGVLRALERFPTNKVTVVPQYVVVGEALVIMAFRSPSDIVSHFFLP